MDPMKTLSVQIPFKPDDIVYVTEEQRVAHPCPHCGIKRNKKTVFVARRCRVDVAHVSAHGLHSRRGRGVRFTYTVRATSGPALSGFSSTFGFMEVFATRKAALAECKKLNSKERRYERESLARARKKSA